VVGRRELSYEHPVLASGGEFWNFGEGRKRIGGC
jgi:hypothetical protein